MVVTLWLVRITDFEGLSALHPCEALLDLELSVYFRVLIHSIWVDEHVLSLLLLLGHLLLSLLFQELLLLKLLLLLLVQQELLLLSACGRCVVCRLPNRVCSDD